MKMQGVEVCVKCGEWKDECMCKTARVSDSSPASGSVPALSNQLAECLAEAVDLIHAIRHGEYEADSLTPQPWKIALQNYSDATGWKWEQNA